MQDSSDNIAPTQPNLRQQTESRKKNRIQFCFQDDNGNGEVSSSKIRLHLRSERDDNTLIDLIAKAIDQTPDFDDFILTGEVGTADSVLLHAASESWAAQRIREIRAHPNHFLKPLLMINETTEVKPESLADCTITGPAEEAQVVEKIERLSRITEKLASLPKIPESLGEIGLKKILLLRYFYSREPFTLRPLRNFHASVGYTFPLVQALFNTEEGQEIAFLENLEEAQLLTTKLIDKVNVCPYCGHSQINFRELCRACRSLNIGEEPTIHHFRCAYVGRESEFRHGFKLSCPKCSRELRHIGVDYDKPSEVMWCNDCNHNFSDPLLSCFCLVCGNTYSPEDVFLKQINEYSLSLEGQRAAEEGVLPGHGLINILKKELGFYKYEVFVEYLRLEVLRCRRYKNPSTFAQLRFNMDGASPENDILRSRKLKNEFSTLLRQTFRTTDLLTDRQNGEIWIVFTHTDYESSKIAFTRLSESIKAMLDKQLHLEYRLLDLSQQSGQIDEILEAAG